MKSILLLLLLLLLAPTVSAQVTRTVDEFTGEVTLIGTGADVQHDASHVARMLVMRTNGSTYLVLMTASTDGWVHLGDDTAYMLHGPSKQRLTLTAYKVESESEVSGNLLILNEVMGIKLTTHALQAPAKLRLGSIVYEIPASVLSDVREIGTRIR